MKITDVRVVVLQDKRKLKGIASVAFDDAIVIHDIKILESGEDFFIAMPSRKVPNGQYKDIAHPLNQETRNMIQEAILEKYKLAASEEEATSTEEGTPNTEEETPNTEEEN